MTHPTRPSRALVLAAHGSQTEPLAAYQTHAHVQRLRATGLFDEVIASFWKEAPEWHVCLDMIESEEVVVVPLLMSQGYFASRVLPRSLKLATTLDVRGRTPHVTESVGTHPALLDAAHDTLAAHIDGVLAKDTSLRPEDFHVIVAGHGTDRDKQSSASVDALVEHLLAQQLDCATVEARFLDEAPRLEAFMLCQVDASHVVVLPYFIASGQHTLRDIPEALSLPPSPHALPYGRHDVDGVQLDYLEPLGAQPTMIDVILARAGKAHTTRQAITQRVSAPSWLTIKQAQDKSAWALTLTRDRHEPTSSLRQFTDPLELWLDLRRAPSDLPFYRSLPTASPLPRGWRLLMPSRAEIELAIDLLFPLVSPRTQADATLSLAGYLDAVGGQYARRLESKIQDPTLAGAIARRCDKGCVLERAWHTTSRPEQNTTALDALDRTCRAPCASLLTELMSVTELSP